MSVEITIPCASADARADAEACARTCGRAGTLHHYLAEHEFRHGGRVHAPFARAPDVSAALGALEAGDGCERVRLLLPADFVMRTLTAPEDMAPADRCRVGRGDVCLGDGVAGAVVAVFRIVDAEALGLPRYQGGPIAAGGMYVPFAADAVPEAARRVYDPAGARARDPPVRVEKVPMSATEEALCEEVGLQRFYATTTYDVNTGFTLAARSGVSGALDAIAAGDACIVCHGEHRGVAACPRCGNTTCVGCMHEWLLRAATCPMCRAELEPADVLASAVEATIPCVPIRTHLENVMREGDVVFDFAADRWLGDVGRVYCPLPEKTTHDVLYVCNPQEIVRLSS